MDPDLANQSIKVTGFRFPQSPQTEILIKIISLTRNFLFNAIICTPAGNTNNNIKSGPRCQGVWLPIWPICLLKKALKYANSLKVKHLGLFSTHLNQRFLLCCACFCWDPNDNWGFTFHEAFRFGEEDKDLYYKHTDVGVTYKGNTDWLYVSMRYRGLF